MVLLKFILIGIILIGMIVLLLSVRALSHPSETINNEEAAQMREEIENNRSPFTSKSVFSNFLARDRRR